MRPATRSGILRIEKGKARDMAYPQIITNATFYKQPSLLAVVAAIFNFPLIKKCLFDKKTNDIMFQERSICGKICMNDSLYEPGDKWI